jgi:hypothetical protein
MVELFGLRTVLFIETADHVLEPLMLFPDPVLRLHEPPLHASRLGNSPPHLGSFVVHRTLGTSNGVAVRT